MKHMEVSDREITHLLLALMSYKKKLLAVDDEDMGDALHDLLMVEALTAKLRQIKEQP